LLKEFIIKVKNLKSKDFAPKGYVKYQ
jgi:hypothetical protein